LSEPYSEKIGRRIAEIPKEVENGQANYNLNKVPSKLTGELRATKNTSSADKLNAVDRSVNWIKWYYGRDLNAAEVKAVDDFKKSLNAQLISNKLEDSKMNLQPANRIADYFSNTEAELNTTLADTTKFVDEIDRKTAKVPEVKPLKYKELTAKSWREFVTDAQGKVDVHNLHKLMNMMIF